MLYHNIKQKMYLLTIPCGTVLVLLKKKQNKKVVVAFADFYGVNASDMWMSGY